MANFLGLKYPMCPSCSTFLSEPYIKCGVCQPHILVCLQCFAKGWEAGQHENNHSYEIITNDFSILDPSWSAKDEMKLLDAMSDHGIGNWHDVANHLPHRTKQECEYHYTKVYINNSRHPLPTFPSNQPKQIKPILYRASDDPPRPLGDSQRSSDMAGYMSARSDFTKEYDNYAEWDLKDIYFQGEEEQLLTDLKYAAVDIYLSRIRERHSRKKIIRNLGLINITKHQMYERSHNQAVRSIFDKMRKFSRLHTPFGHDKLIEGLVYELDLRKEVKRLQDYRKNGINSIVGAKAYDKLNLRREQCKLKKRSLLSEVLIISSNPAACEQWLQRQALVDAGIKKLPLMVIPSNRRSSTPLDLTGYAGYDRLNDKERELCAMVRIIPEAYFEYKRVFQNECSKIGFLKLKNARNLIRIDVNKIRKVFDFMVREGFINTS